MLKKYLRQERVYKSKEGEKPDINLIIKRIKDRISSAEPYSPIVVFKEDGVYYEFFARTVMSKKMIADKRLHLVGIFHKDMPEGHVNSLLTIH